MLFSKLEIFLKNKMIEDLNFEENETFNIFNEANENNEEIIDYLVKKNIFSSEKIANLISSQFNVNYSTINKNNIDFISTKKLINICKKFSFIFINSDSNSLIIVAGNPFNKEMIEELNFHLEEQYEIHVGKVNSIKKFLSSFNEIFVGNHEEHNYKISLNDEFEHIDISEENVFFNEENDNVTAVNKLLVDAFSKNASDIHLEPKTEYYKIRYRVDGKLFEVERRSTDLMNGIISRLKVISGLNITEKRKPQEGRFSININSKSKADFRISVIPMVHGEKVVIRILDSLYSNIGLNKIGMSEQEKFLYKEALNKTQGLILVTGPTGAGKSITLFSGIKELPIDELNVTTVESPVEVQLDEINQININENKGMSYPETLRYVLRQDPDVIMIGEIRDLETLDIALKASQTGHLVLATLHAKNSIQAVERLETMEPSIFNIVNSMSLICSQRLVRKLCNNCKIEKKVEPHLIEEFKKLGVKLELNEKYHIHDEEGCDECFSGYSGRIAVFEILKLDEDIKKELLKKTSFDEIEKMAQNKGFINLNESGLEKLRNGIISIEDYISNFLK